MVLFERGFVVEEVDMREAFRLEEAEDAFGFGGEVGERGEAADCLRSSTAGRASSGTPCGKTPAASGRG